MAHQEFGAKKAAGAFKNGQVPVLEVNGEQVSSVGLSVHHHHLHFVQIAQSTAILSYAGNLAGLNGKTPFEQLKVNEALFNVEDVASLFTATYGLEGAEKEKARLAIAAGPMKEWFDRFEAHIAGSKRYGGAFVLYLQTFMLPAVSGSATPSPPPI